MASVLFEFTVISGKPISIIMIQVFSDHDESRMFFKCFWTNWNGVTES